MFRERATIPAYKTNKSGFVGFEARMRAKSFQLRVLGPGLFQDGDVRVGVFPQREEIQIRSTGFGGVGEFTSRSVSLSVSACLAVLRLLL